MPISQFCYHIDMGNVNRVQDRFWAKVTKSDTCWLWTAAVDKSGYGRMHYLTGSEYAHRISYLLHKGAIPPKKVIDHKCRVRSCVNPEHLQILTRAENSSQGNKGKGKDICKRGHDLTNPDNVSFSTRRSGPRAGEVWRVCAECNRENARSQYAIAQSAKLINRE